MTINRRVFALGMTCIWAVGFTLASSRSLAGTGKSWQFKTESGTVTIVLGGTSEAPSLEMICEDDAHPSLATEVNFIKNVLKALPAVGVDPRELRGISMRGFVEPDLAQRVAIASLSSKEWKSRSIVPGGDERALKDLLNSIGAYEPLNVVLGTYGVQAKVGGVEKVSSSKCSHLSLPGVDCSQFRDPRLPTGGNIFLSLARISAGAN
jgi:hypothetical protein